MTHPTATVIQDCRFKVLGPKADQNVSTHGKLELVWNQWEPLQFDLLFHQDGLDTPTVWQVSRDMFTAAVRSQDSPHVEGYFQVYQSTDLRGLIMSMTDGKTRAVAEILLCMAKFFVDEVDRVCPVGSHEEADAVDALIEETLAVLLYGNPDGLS